MVALKEVAEKPEGDATPILSLHDTEMLMNFLNSYDSDPSCLKDAMSAAKFDVWKKMFVSNTLSVFELSCLQRILTYVSDLERRNKISPGWGDRAIESLVSQHDHTRKASFQNLENCLLLLQEHAKSFTSSDDVVNQRIYPFKAYHLYLKEKLQSSNRRATDSQPTPDQIFQTVLNAGNSLGEKPDCSRYASADDCQQIHELVEAYERIRNRSFLLKAYHSMTSHGRKLKQQLQNFSMTRMRYTD
jgi:hypothetical protein